MIVSHDSCLGDVEDAHFIGTGRVISLFQSSRFSQRRLRRQLVHRMVSLKDNKWPGSLCFIRVLSTWWFCGNENRPQFELRFHRPTSSVLWKVAFSFENEWTPRNMNCPVTIFVAITLSNFAVLDVYDKRAVWLNSGVSKLLLCVTKNRVQTLQNNAPDLTTPTVENRLFHWKSNLWKIFLGVPGSSRLKS